MCKLLTAQSTRVRQGIAWAPCGGALMCAALAMGECTQAEARRGKGEEFSAPMQGANATRQPRCWMVQACSMRRSQAHGWRMARQACVYAQPAHRHCVVAVFKVCSAPVPVDVNHHQAAQEALRAATPSCWRSEGTQPIAQRRRAERAPQTRDGSRIRG